MAAVSHLVGANRQRELKDSAVRHIRGRPEPSAVGLDNRAADRQPLAHPVRRGRIEGAEEAVDDLLPHPALRRWRRLLSRLLSVAARRWSSLRLTRPRRLRSRREDLAAPGRVSRTATRRSRRAERFDTPLVSPLHHSRPHSLTVAASVSAISWTSAARSTTSVWIKRLASASSVARLAPSVARTRSCAAFSSFWISASIASAVRSL